MNDHELQVLSEQLDELLSSGADDADDALEIAAIAGMMQRLGCPRELLVDAERWRVGAGGALLDEAWDELDLDDLLEAVDGLTGGDATDAEVEEAVLDFDELVAAAVWCGRDQLVTRAAADVERTIRTVPEAFASLAPMGRDLARLPTVARNQHVYGFWLAIADAGDYLEA